MPSNLEMRVLRLEGLVHRLGLDVAKLRDEVARLRQQRFAEQGGQSGEGGGVSGIFYADHLNIAAHSTGSGYDIYQSWNATLASSSATIRNVLPDATDSAKRQLLGKNPDGSYTVIAESCTDE